MTSLGLTIFQSTLPRGERLYPINPHTVISRFQSTLPRGERRFICVTMIFSTCISIHAPTRGATGVPVLHSSFLVYFNPRSHEGSDRYWMEIMTTKWNFNPRSHEGSDQERLEKLLHCLNFNPRSHEGSDLQKTWCLLSFTDFNPRSHEGSDVCLLMPMPLSGIFQSTLPRGERQSTASASSDTSISIHAPTRGATNLLQLLVIFVRFQSTLPRGERHKSCIYCY